MKLGEQKKKRKTLEKEKNKEANVSVKTAIPLPFKFLCNGNDTPDRSFAVRTFKVIS